MAFNELFFSQLALGHIASDTQNLFDFAGMVIYRFAGPGDPYSGPIAVQIFIFVRHKAMGIQHKIRNHISKIITCGIYFRNYGSYYVSTNDFVTLESEKNLGKLIEVCNGPVSVDSHDNAVGIFYQFAITRFALLQFTGSLLYLFLQKEAESGKKKGQKYSEKKRVKYPIGKLTVGREAAKPLSKCLIIKGVLIPFPCRKVSIDMTEKFMLCTFLAGEINGERAENDCAANKVVFLGMAQTEMLRGDAGICFSILHSGKDIGMGGQFHYFAVNIEASCSLLKVDTADIAKHNGYLAAFEIVDVDGFPVRSNKNLSPKFCNRFIRKIHYFCSFVRIGNGHHQINFLFLQTFEALCPASSDKLYLPLLIPNHFSEQVWVETFCFTV